GRWPPRRGRNPLNRSPSWGSWLSSGDCVFAIDLSFRFAYTQTRLQDSNHRRQRQGGSMNSREFGSGGGSGGQGHPPISVTVNEHLVTLEARTFTGAQIKAAAIAQGVAIQPNFVLQEELPNGTSRIIGDADEVHWREHLRFTAIAPDDNS